MGDWGDVFDDVVGRRLQQVRLAEVMKERERAAITARVNRLPPKLRLAMKTAIRNNPDADPMAMLESSERLVARRVVGGQKSS